MVCCEAAARIQITVTRKRQIATDEERVNVPFAAAHYGVVALEIDSEVVMRGPDGGSLCPVASFGLAGDG